MLSELIGPLDTLDQCTELIVLPCNGTRQGELDSSPEKILLWITHLKITVLDQIIAIKAQAEFKADQPGAVNKERPVSRQKKVSSRCQVSFDYSSKKVRMEVDILRALHLFAQGVAAGAEAITDIVEEKTGAYRIQINEADDFLAV